MKDTKKGLQDQFRYLLSQIEKRRKEYGYRKEQVSNRFCICLRTYDYWLKGSHIPQSSMALLQCVYTAKSIISDYDKRSQVEMERIFGFEEAREYRERNV